MSAIWDSTKTVEDALSLPTGRIAADFGFLVEQSVNPDWTLEAAEKLITEKWQGKAATQAEIIVEAQTLGALENLAPLKSL